MRNGLGDRLGRGKGQPVRLFRFIPSDAILVVFDLDRGHEDDSDGISAFDNRFALEGDNVRLTLEIEANFDKDVPDHVVRTISENGRSLKFDSQGFERE